MNRSTAALMAMLAMIVPVAACGIRPTGVTAAGDPPVASEAVPQTTVYLVRNGLLVPARRTTFPRSPQAALYALRQGVTEQERSTGLQDPVSETYVSQFEATFSRGVLYVFYHAPDETASPNVVLGLVHGQIVCTGMVQPGVRKVILVPDGDPMAARTCTRYKGFMSQ